MKPPNQTQVGTPSNLLEELAATVDPQTLEILDHRRKSENARRRGWLVRRALLTADVLGLALAFVAAQVATGTGGRA